MEELRTDAFPIQDENLELRIKHWELRLSDSLEAVRVAQEQLGVLYPQRYPQTLRDLGSTGLQMMLDSGRRLDENNT